MTVVPHRPGRRVVVVLLTIVGAGLLAVGSYQVGRMRAGTDWEAVERLLSEQESSSQSTLDLERRLADAELSTVVDAEANEQLRQSIKSLRDELAETAEEVRFYRGLMAPSEAQKGLRIEKLDLTGVGDRIDYRLLMTQIVDRHNWVKGQIKVDLVGQSEGREQVLSLTDLTEVEEYPLQFRFRYFQDFTGTLTLPADFEPARVVVTAAHGGDGRQLQRTFNWNIQEG